MASNMHLRSFCNRGRFLSLIAGAAWGITSFLVGSEQTTVAAAPSEPVRQGPVPLKPGDHGIGQIVAATSFTDLEGRPHTIGDAEGFTVFAATGTSCPLSLRFVPTLVDLVASAPAGFRFVLVNPTASDDAEAMRRDAARVGGGSVYVHDADGTLSQALGLLTTTDVVIVDASRTVRYHGAVDDQYGFGYALDAPRQTFLRDAIRALASGREPTIAATDAPGCELALSSPVEHAVAATYHGEVSRLLQRHCVECHRDGGAGPFALDTYDDVVAHAGMIREVVRRGVMPPWFAADESHQTDEASVHAAHQLQWANDRSLAASEKQALLTWLDGGTPAGNPADAPQPRSYPEGWLIGEPDTTWEFAEAVPVKATGVMPYQDIVVETGLTEDRWVRAIEVRPGSPAVVHHVLVHVLRPGDDGVAHDEREGFWALYVPGQSVLEYPEGFAKKLPAGARLNFQMHYTPNGTATADRTRIGVVFCDEPEHEVRTTGIVNTRISIPPGAANHQEQASIRLPYDATVIGLLPHMHVRGKACRYELTRAGGETTTLLDVPHYDFNWQLLYRLARPLPLSAGDRLTFTAWFDNSQDNPANPDPTATIGWGPQTFDEMHLGYVEYYLPEVPPGEQTAERGWWGRFVSNLERVDLDAAFTRLDTNSDGTLTPDELPERLRDRLMRLDVDRDGSISRQEAARLRRR